MSAVQAIELGARLKKDGRWPVHSKKTVDLDGETLALEILQPPSYQITKAIEEARAAGDLDANYKPIGDLGKQRFRSRMVCLCMHAPGGDALFDESDVDAVASSSWICTVQLDCMAAVLASGGNLARLYAGIGHRFVLMVLLIGLQQMLTRR